MDDEDEPSKEVTVKKKKKDHSVLTSELKDVIDTYGRWLLNPFFYCAACMSERRCPFCHCCFMWSILTFFRSWWLWWWRGRSISSWYVFYIVLWKKLGVYAFKWLSCQQIRTSRYDLFNSHFFELEWSLIIIMQIDTLFKYIFSLTSVDRVLDPSISNMLYYKRGENDPHFVDSVCWSHKLRFCIVCDRWNEITNLLFVLSQTSVLPVCQLQ